MMHIYIYIIYIYYIYILYIIHTLYYSKGDSKAIQHYNYRIPQRKDLESSSLSSPLSLSSSSLSVSHQ